MRSNSLDEASLVELGFAAGAHDVAAVCMICDLMKFTTLPGKELMEWVDQKWVYLEYKDKLEEFQNLDESTHNFEQQHICIC